MRPSLLMSSITGQLVNQECESSVQGTACRHDCDHRFQECIYHCNHDIECAGKCIDQDEYCINDCPCYQECWEGCPCDYYTIWCPDETCHTNNEISFKYCTKETEVDFVECTYLCVPFDLLCQQGRGQ